MTSTTRAMFVGMLLATSVAGCVDIHEDADEGSDADGGKADVWADDCAFGQGFEEMSDRFTVGEPVEFASPRGLTTTERRQIVRAVRESEESVRTIEEAFENEVMQDNLIRRYALLDNETGVRYVAWQF